MVLLLKLFSWMLKTATNSTGKLKTKLALRAIQFNSFFNYEFFISAMDMFQLDFYLAIYLQLHHFEIRSNKSAINIFLAVLIGLAMIFTKVILYFFSTRVAIISK
jgi:hypothetical protein